MMKYIEIYKAIQERLQAEGYSVLSAGLENSSIGEATGGEAIDLIRGYLINIRKTNSTAFECVRDMVNEFLSLTQNV